MQPCCPKLTKIVSARLNQHAGLVPMPDPYCYHIAAESVLTLHFPVLDILCSTLLGTRWLRAWLAAPLRGRIRTQAGVSSGMVKTCTLTVAGTRWGEAYVTCVCIQLLLRMLARTYVIAHRLSLNKELRTTNASWQIDNHVPWLPPHALFHPTLVNLTFVLRVGPTYIGMKGAMLGTIISSCLGLGHVLCILLNKCFASCPSHYLCLLRYPKAVYNKYLFFLLCCWNSSFCLEELHWTGILLGQSHVYQNKPCKAKALDITKQAKNCLHLLLTGPPWALQSWAISNFRQWCIAINQFYKH